MGVFDKSAIFVILFLFIAFATIGFFGNFGNIGSERIVGGGTTSPFSPDTYLLHIDESVTVSGKTLTLFNVGSSASLQVDVDGSTETVSACEVAETVNGLSAEIMGYTYDEDPTQRWALLQIVRSDDYFFRFEESKVINDNTVTLMNVGSTGSVQLSVNGEIITIQDQGTRVVQGLSITVLDTFYDGDDPTQRTAMLRIVPYPSTGGSPLKIKTTAG